MKEINVKSESGFTMTDLAVAIIIFTMFASLIGTLMYTAFRTELQTKIAGQANFYAIEILEDIDKITYDEVVNGMESHYRDIFSISNSYDLKIEVTNYNEGTNKEDLIKNFKLTITYKLDNNTESLVVNKIKVKEL